MPTGRFIVIEGLDGSGKTTQFKRLSAAMPHALTTCEPTSREFGTVIRRTLRGEPGAPSPLSLPWAFAADRADHLVSVVEPALVEGRDVICDRYLPSSLAYQSLTLPLERVWAMNRSFRVPDVTFWLDVTAEVAAERIGMRGGTVEIYDALDRLKQVNEAYHTVFRFLEGKGWRIEKIDGSGDADEIQDRMGVNPKQSGTGTSATS